MAGPRVSVKRVYEAAAASDGVRVLVDRLWPRGLSKEKAGLDAWMKELGPSHALRRWFGHDPARWDEFCLRYADELGEREELLSELVSLAGGAGRLTLLFSARDEERNQAVALRDHLVSTRRARG